MNLGIEGYGLVRREHMAQSNHERVGKALELLNKGLQPFIEREMQATYGTRWQYEAASIAARTPLLG